MRAGTVYGPIPKTIRDRLEANYEPEPNSGCWIWIGNWKLPHGYGRMVVGHMGLGTRRQDLAHRVSYKEFVGPIPSGLHVLHRCDNPPCINPQHLFLGTAADNVTDMLMKRRVHSKVTWTQVDEIRQAAIAGESQVGIARRYGITQVAVGHIINEKTWRLDTRPEAIAAGERGRYGPGI